MTRNLRDLMPIILVAAINLYGGSCASPQSGTTARISEPVYSENIDVLLDSLTIRQKIAQLMFVWAGGRFQADHDPAFVRLSNLIQDEQIGGIVFSQGDVYGQAMMVNKLQSISKIPIWITQDMEYGAAMRISGTTWFPPAMGVAAAGNPVLEYQKGKITAIEARNLGVHQIFAPVADVNNNPANPVISVRSYGENPDSVAVYAIEFIRGAQDQGVLATVKHFPGHGDTDLDSHLTLPVINQHYARLDSVELVPFKAVIKAGVGSVMSAHIAFPQIGVNPERPGTLDPAILTGILRDSLGFDGLVVTDALQMKGIADFYSPGEAAIKALLAGADLLLIPIDIRSAIDEVEYAIAQGRLSEERLNQSVRKLLNLKKSHGLFGWQPIDINSLSSVIHTKEFRLISEDISRKSITLLKNEDDILPLSSVKFPDIALVTLNDDETSQSNSAFAVNLRNYHPQIQTYTVSHQSTAFDLKHLQESLKTVDLIIVAPTVRITPSPELNSSHQSFLDYIRESDIPIVMVSFGTPYIVQHLPEAKVHMLAWHPHNQQMEAAADALFGASAMNGRLPIRIPGMYNIGFGISQPGLVLRSDYPEVAGLSADTLYRIEPILRDAVRNRTFPGAVVMVTRNGIITHHEAIGYHDYDRRRPVHKNDIFDLASITKVMGTTLATIKLVDDGFISLDQPVSDFFSEFLHAEKSGITIRHLLLHESGLPPFRVYVDSIQTRKEIIQAVLNEPLTEIPGEKYVYSDLGMIIMALIVEKVIQISIDEFLNDQFFMPLGMSSTMYNPLNRDKSLINRILPAELDTVYRKSLVHGKVHDERAWYMDGIAGHAGLFSNAPDMAVFAQLFLNKGEYGGKRYLKTETIELFTSRTGIGNRRALGFDKKNLDGFTTAGNLASDNAFGHTGFTGTSIWVDPEKNTAIIILTNRTFPFRSTSYGVNWVRSDVANIVWRSFTE